jgi:hypothetical protein
MIRLMENREQVPVINFEFLTFYPLMPKSIGRRLFYYKPAVTEQLKVEGLFPP